MKRKLRTAAVCLLASVSAPALALFGGGIPVFDSANWAESIQQLMQLQQQYSQLVKTYNEIRQQYEHMVRMAQRVPVDMRTRYRALPTPWRSSSATNTYGTTAGWISAINTGANVASGYSRAIQALPDYGAALGQIPADQVDRIKTAYATVELTDGANLYGIETLGQLRGNSAAVERAIQSLEDDSLSADPNMNTEIAVLNKINAANLIAVRTTQDANKLLVALAEAQIVEAKRTRDAEAYAINNHIRFMRDGKAAMAAQASGASSAMLAWRMP